MVWMHSNLFKIKNEKFRVEIARLDMALCISQALLLILMYEIIGPANNLNAF